MSVLTKTYGTLLFNGFFGKTHACTPSRKNKYFCLLRTHKGLVILGLRKYTLYNQNSRFIISGNYQVKSTVPRCPDNAHDAERRRPLSVL